MKNNEEYNKGYNEGYDCGYSGGNLIRFYESESADFLAGYMDGNKDGHNDRPKRNW
jgi:hypothetical protein